MHFRKAVALGEQIEDAARVGDEAALAQRLRIGGRGLLVTRHQHGQALMRFVECFDDGLARTLERHAPHVEPRDARRVAGEQPFDRRAIGTDETFARMAGIGKSRFEQQKKITAHRARHLIGT
ncbi:hypothetical protein PPGU19_044930 [Paraburkholderia sp. PGU19]|nr:hypothetical protein PPGU19_044930 [Paraburkholderia sp. PGU19]